jgi:hypothetical protein
LVDGTNLYQVFSTIYKVGGQAQKQGYTGPVIGVKQGSSNKREFTEEQLRSGQNTIGLQVPHLIYYSKSIKTTINKDN